jgi:hypothetical protein
VALELLVKVLLVVTFLVLVVEAVLVAVVPQALVLIRLILTGQMVVLVLTGNH